MQAVMTGRRHAAQPVMPGPRRGSDHKDAKITEDDVRQMRSARRSGQTIDQVFLTFGPRLGISHWNVREILSGRAWKHVD